MSQDRLNLTAVTLDDFDVLELLFMLARAERSGSVCIQHARGEFRVALVGGRVRDMSLGDLHDDEALAALIEHPSGEVHFEERLNARAADQSPFDAPERLEHLLLSERELAWLAELNTGHTVEALSREPEAAALLARLARLGLLVPRKARVARLTLKVARDLRGPAQLDEMILDRWQEELGLKISQVELRTEAGGVFSLAVQPARQLGATLLISPAALLQNGLSSGSAVLARPAALTR
jgi:Domain of unknown function (DUF4388)